MLRAVSQRSQCREDFLITNRNHHEVDVPIIGHQIIRLRDSTTQDIVHFISASKRVLDTPTPRNPMDPSSIGYAPAPSPAPPPGPVDSFPVNSTLGAALIGAYLSLM